MSRIMLACMLVWTMFAAVATATGPASSQPGVGPPGSMPLPDGLGVNIHFTDPRPGEMKMLTEGGFRWVRMDLGWNGTERRRGEYDFRAFDRLVEAGRPHGIGFLFILDYGNRLYDGDWCVTTDEGRQAMARWAVAAVQHFKGRGILWEMWNEPNISGFWKPKPDVAAYAQLALEVGKAIRQAAPDEMYIGPATSTIDFAFLEACFKAGLLEYWMAVSVHPYRQQPPETAAADYTRLRRLIDQYAPKGKRIPIYSGEWGYSSAWRGMDEAKQGKMLPRQWLMNLANDVPLSIWYDWHDDGKDPKEPEHHFGTVLFPYNAGREPVYDAKPAYLAARTLSAALAGCRFNKRLSIGGQDDYVLLFAAEAEMRLAAWTTAATPHEVTIPASPGTFRIADHLGKALPDLAADKAGLKVRLIDAPQYIVPTRPNDLLRLAAAWRAVPPEIVMPAGRKSQIAVALKNPLDRAIRVIGEGGRAFDLAPGQTAAITRTFDLPRQAEPLTVAIECEVEVEGAGAGAGANVLKLSQTTLVSASNPFAVTFLPPAGKAFSVRVGNPSGEAFSGRIELTGTRGLPLRSSMLGLAFAAGQTDRTVTFPLDEPVAEPYAAGAIIDDGEGQYQLVLPPAEFQLVDEFSRYPAGAMPAGYGLAADGDAKVVSAQTATVEAPPEGAPVPGAGCVKIAYQFDAGWKFIRFCPPPGQAATIEGKPKALGMWLYGDGSGNHLRLRFVDSTGQTFQPAGLRLTWKGWRYVTFSLEAANAGYWGGANDGAIHHPIRWDTLLLIDSAERQKTQGHVYIASPVLIRNRDDR